MMQYDVIVQRLENYRKKYAFLQADIASSLDITQSQYSKLETGKTKLSYDALSKLYKLGWDIDMIITGESLAPVLSTLEQRLAQCDEADALSMLRLCGWALERWNLQDAKGPQVGEKLLQVHTGPERDLSALEKLRKVYDLSQIKMAEIIGVNIKKYRELEHGSLQLDAELMSIIYEVTKCKPSFFMDENKYYLSVISEECSYDTTREEQLNELLSMQEKFDNHSKTEEK